MADRRFGTFLAPNLMPFYEALPVAVGTRLGLTTELVVETGYEDCVNDVCFVCSLAFVMFEREGYRPPCRCQRQSWREPAIAAFLSTSRMSWSTATAPIGRSSTCREVRGPSTNRSHSPGTDTRYHLVSIGETTGFFKKVIESGYHEVSMSMVTNGQVDASAIDSHCLSVELRRNHAFRRSVRIIDSLGPSPIQPITVSKRLDSTLRQGIVDIFTTLHLDEDGRAALALGTVDRIVAIGSEHLDESRRMHQVCEQANYLTLRQPNLLQRRASAGQPTHDLDLGEFELVAGAAGL